MGCFWILWIQFFFNNDKKIYILYRYKNYVITIWKKKDDKVKNLANLDDDIDNIVDISTMDINQDKIRENLNYYSHYRVENEKKSSGIFYWQKKPNKWY